MLFINPHIPLHDFYEGHLHSDEGLNVSGGFVYGSFLFPFAGLPASRHDLNLAPLYVAGKYKPAWFNKSDVVKNTERAYHPGDQANGGLAPAGHIFGIETRLAVTGLG